MQLSSVGRDPCPAADALVGLYRSWFNHNQPGEGARRGSGEPPHQNYADLGKLSGISHSCVRFTHSMLSGAID